jgi:hypothetical protein
VPASALSGSLRQQVIEMRGKLPQIQIVSDVLAKASKQRQQDVDPDRGLIAANRA